ncbi:hypothetical protein V1264_015833 [Littorina saxatilis]|uniref:Uncharacterized protein n=1 Tax=Littorina saxatilis TaxID=31220 RepID=A0AAN9BMK9_9CAEN
MLAEDNDHWQGDTVVRVPTIHCVRTQRMGDWRVKSMFCIRLPPPPLTQGGRGVGSRHSTLPRTKESQAHCSPTAVRDTLPRTKESQAHCSPTAVRETGPSRQNRSDQFEPTRDNMCGQLTQPPAPNGAEEEYVT